MKKGYLLLAVILISIFTDSLQAELRNLIIGDHTPCSHIFGTKWKGFYNGAGDCNCDIEFSVEGYKDQLLFQGTMSNVSGNQCKTDCKSIKFIKIGTCSDNSVSLMKLGQDWSYKGSIIDDVMICNHWDYDAKYEYFVVYKQASK